VVQVIYRPNQAPSYKINEDDVQLSDLQTRLTGIYANRAERVMFVRGDDDVDFQYIANVIDIGKAANVDHIGLMTPKIQAGQ
jgi:biopolymer transport protein ExbD